MSKWAILFTIVTIVQIGAGAGFVLTNPPQTTIANLTVLFLGAAIGFCLCASITLWQDAKEERG